MGIKPKFSKADIEKLFMKRLERIEEVIVNELIYIGESFVKNAREKGTYKDRTGNLRSSIGYAIYKNGKSLTDNFQQSGKGTDKQTGVSTAKKLVKELRSEHLKGYVLIVVAGMNYAAAVESKGLDVLTSSSLAAKRDLQRAISSIKRKVKQL